MRIYAMLELEEEMHPYDVMRNKEWSDSRLEWLQELAIFLVHYPTRDLREGFGLLMQGVTFYRKLVTTGEIQGKIVVIIISLLYIGKGGTKGTNPAVQLTEVSEVPVTIYSNE